MMSLHNGWGWQPTQTTFCIDIVHFQSVSAHWYAVHRHMVAVLHSYTHPTWLRVWVLCHLRSWNDVIMSWLRLTTTSNCLSHWYETYTNCLSNCCAVHWHKAAALCRSAHPTWLRFWGSGSLVGSKWCHYVMVEVDNHLLLLSTSILNMYKV